MRLWGCLLLCMALLAVGINSDDESLCPGPGVQPNPSDRRSFYICVGTAGDARVARLVDCPPGYLFSRLELTCTEEHASLSSRVSRATPAGCQVLGPYCESCERMVVCARIDGRLQALSNMSCPEVGDNLVCNNKTMGCQNAASVPTCAGANSVSSFRCLQPGFFPDDTDCTKYHICDENLNHYSDSCDVLYDALNATCADAAVPCAAPVASPCSATNMAPAAISTNPSFYRICIPVISRPLRGGDYKVSFQTSVLRCPDQKEFSDATMVCEFVCKKKSSRFADPDNCHAYFDCPAATGAPTKKTCTDGLAFDSIKKFCVPESNVPGCHVITTRQVTDSVSTNATQSTTATPVNQATPSVASNQTARPTTTQTLHDFRCPREGSFIDRSNCRRYFFCYRFWRVPNTMNMMHMYCLPFMYFNENAGYCQFGFC